jgi:hypothetical protein
MQSDDALRPPEGDRGVSGAFVGGKSAGSNGGYSLAQAFPPLNISQAFPPLNIYCLTRAGRHSHLVLIQNNSVLRKDVPFAEW